MSRDVLPQDAGRPCRSSAPPSGINTDLASFDKNETSLVAWISALLFGGITTIGARQMRQRWFLQDLLVESEIVAVQEAWGVAADLTTIPPTHSYIGTCCPATGAATPAAGCTFIAVRESVRARAMEEFARGRIRGRALPLSLRFRTWFHFMVAHVDSAQTLGAAHAFFLTSAGTSRHRRVRCSDGRQELHPQRRNSNGEHKRGISTGHQPRSAC